MGLGWLPGCPPPAPDLRSQPAYIPAGHWATPTAYRSGGAHHNNCVRLVQIHQSIWLLDGYIIAAWKLDNTHDKEAPATHGAPLLGEENTRCLHLHNRGSARTYSSGDGCREATFVGEYIDCSLWVEAKNWVAQELYLWKTESTVIVRSEIVIYYFPKIWY